MDMLGLSLEMSRPFSEAMDERSHLAADAVRAWKTYGCVEVVCTCDDNTKPLSSAQYNFGLECPKTRKAQQALDKICHRETEVFSTGRQQKP